MVTKDGACSNIYEAHHAVVEADRAEPRVGELRQRPVADVEVDHAPCRAQQCSGSVTCIDLKLNRHAASAMLVNMLPTAIGELGPMQHQK